MFHCLSHFCADNFVGVKSPERPEKAWLQVYRSLDHRTVRKACEKCYRSLGTSAGFPQDIIDFASDFAAAQQLRHDADYNPKLRLKRNDVLLHLASVKGAIAKFVNADTKHKRAFAALVMFRDRR